MITSWLNFLFMKSGVFSTVSLLLLSQFLIAVLARADVIGLDLF
jgi:hypothetical protein